MRVRTYTREMESFGGKDTCDDSQRYFGKTHVLQLDGGRIRRIFCVTGLDLHQAWWLIIINVHGCGIVLPKPSNTDR